MIKYEKPRLADLKFKGTEGYPDCADGSAVMDSCTGGGTVAKGCAKGGIPTIVACVGGGGF